MSAPVWENYPHTLPDNSWITFDWIGETRGQKRRRLAREAAEAEARLAELNTPGRVPPSPPLYEPW